MKLEESSIIIIKACKTCEKQGSFYDNVVSKISKIVGIKEEDLDTSDILYWLDRTVKDCELNINITDMASYMQRKIDSCKDTKTVNMYYLLSLSLICNLRNMTISHIENY